MKYEKIRTPQELYNFMKENTKYGFISKDDGKVYVREKIKDDTEFRKLAKTRFSFPIMFTYF